MGDNKNPEEKTAWCEKCDYFTPSYTRESTAKNGRKRRFRYCSNCTLIQTSRIPAYRGAKNAATTPTGSRDLPRTVKGLRTFTNTAKFVTAL